MFPFRAIAKPGWLWSGLAVCYLAASASGYRGIALGAAGLMVATALAVSGRGTAGLAAGLVLAGTGLYRPDALFLVAYVPPIAGFAFMAFFFQRTLRHGSEPLITRVARKEHPDLPLEIARYTRTLTWLWAWCFAALLAAALALAPALPLDSWSRCVQISGVALPSALFLGEYVYRRHRLRDYRHGSLLVLIVNSIAVIKEAAVNPSSGNPAG